MKTTMQLLILALVMLLAPTIQAQDQDLYSGEVAVGDEGPDARTAGLRQILRQVVVRVSGRRDILENPSLEKVLQRAASLVQQFRYRMPEGGAEAGAGLLLWARFDPEAVNRLLREQGIAAWPGPRPRVLLWLAEEHGVRRELLNPSEEPALLQALRETARRRGMALQLPLLDLEDQSLLSAADLWADYAPAIREVSARYPHDALLSGRLRSLGDGKWSADWTLREGGRSESFRTRGATREAAVVAGLELAQDRLAMRHQPMTAAGGAEVMVRIEGIETLQAYGRLMRWLQKEGILREVRLRAADGLALVLAASAASRERLLAGLDQTLLLRPLPTPSARGRGLEGIAVERSYAYAGGP